MNVRIDKIIYHEAECSQCCEDPQCPYMHFESWEVAGEHYRTEAEALAAADTARRLEHEGLSRDIDSEAYFEDGNH